MERQEQTGGTNSKTRRRGRLVRLFGLVALAGGSLLASLSAAGVFTSGASAAPLKATRVLANELTITGSSATLLYPGTVVSVDLSFANSSTSAVTVKTITATVQAGTTNAGCVGTTNYALANADTAGGNAFTFSTALVIPANSTRSLTQLGVATANWPQITMLNLPVNQNACSGAGLTVVYGFTGPDTATTTTTTGNGNLTPPTLGRPAVTQTPKTQTVTVGKKATFKLTVKNAGKSALTRVTLEDPLATACARTIGTLRAGASKTFTCTSKAVKKAFTNVVTVSGKTTKGTTVRVKSTAKVKTKAALQPPKPAAIAIAVTPKKATLKITTHKQGGKTLLNLPSAHIKIKVTNIGQTTLRGVVVTDPAVKACKHTIGTLAPHASRTYMCVQKGIKSGFTNAATATGTSPAGKKVMATANAPVFKVTATNGVTVKNNGGHSVTLTIPDVLFAFNEATLTPGATHALETVLAVLKQDYPTGHLTITGYTDSVGSAAYNLDLSKRRATTVTNWLEQHGIPVARVTIAYKGEADPVATNATAKGRQQNRRVTIMVRTGH